MTQMHDTRPGLSRAGVTNTVPNTTDQVTRRIRLHEVVRQRRWSLDLDRVINPLEPIIRGWPTYDVFAAGRLGVRERALAGAQ